MATKLDLAEYDGTIDVLLPYISLAWAHQILDPSASANEVFAGIASSSFKTISANPGRNAANVGLGFSLVPGTMPNLNFYLRYDGSFSANETANAVTIGGKYSW